MLDDFDGMLPVTCDKFTSSLVSWYNKKTKKIISDEEYFAHPENMADHIKINRTSVDNFYAKAK